MRTLAWITEIKIMIIIIFLLSISVYFMDILYDYKINFLPLILAKIFRIFIII